MQVLLKNSLKFAFFYFYCYNIFDYFLFMKIFTKILLAIFFILPTAVFAQNNNEINISSEMNQALDNINIDGTKHRTSIVGEFLKPFQNYFFTSDSTNWKTTVTDIFVSIAFAIKNVVLLIATIFLIISVINVFLANWDDASVKKWKNNIVYTTIWIFFMQIAFMIWDALLVENPTGVSTIGADLGWNFWNKIISPIVGFIQWWASFAFMAMMFYAFYIIVTGGWDEDKLKKWKSTFFMALIGFLMIQLPYRIVGALYGGIPDCSSSISNMWSYSQNPCRIADGWSANFNEWVSLVADIFKYINSFLTLACVILVIYAGFLYMTSSWEESKTKKAKNIIIYIAIGLILLVASHAIFVFFFNAWR